MDINKEREAYLAKLLEYGQITQDELNDLKYKIEINAFDSNYLSLRFVDKINFGWSTWQASANRDGFVLVPKDKVCTYFQDDDEPENYCDEGNLNGLGDCLDGDDIISVSKYDQATISKVKMFGVWDYKQTKNGAERVKFVICNTRQEAEAYVAKFLSYLGIEAQEQSHE